jgi:hypothetical protein
LLEPYQGRRQLVYPVPRRDDHSDTRATCFRLIPPRYPFRAVRLMSCLRSDVPEVSLQDVMNTTFLSLSIGAGPLREWSLVIAAIEISGEILRSRLRARSASRTRLATTGRSSLVGPSSCRSSVGDLQRIFR